MNSKTSSKNKKRRSDSERRLKFITPYLDLIYKGENQREDDDRRKGTDRRKEPRD